MNDALVIGLSSAVASLVLIILAICQKAQVPDMLTYKNLQQWLVQI